MGGSFYTEQTKTVEIDAENSVTVRRLTWGENADVWSESQVIQKDGLMRSDSMRWTVKRVEKSIVSWSGPGFEGREPTPENIHKLPRSIGRKIADAVEGINEDLGEDEGN